MLFYAAYDGVSKAIENVIALFLVSNCLNSILRKTAVLILHLAVKCCLKQQLVPIAITRDLESSEGPFRITLEKFEDAALCMYQC